MRRFPGDEKSLEATGNENDPYPHMKPELLALDDIAIFEVLMYSNNMSALFQPEFFCTCSVEAV